MPRDRPDAPPPAGGPPAAGPEPLPGPLADGDPRPGPAAAPRRPPGAAPRPGAAAGPLPGPLRWTQPVAWIPVAILALILLTLLVASRLEYFGPGFYGPDWNPYPNDPARASYGVLYFVIGTILTSVIALVLAMLLSLALSAALVVYLRPILSRTLGLFVDLLAGIPSVVYGIWGYVILAPVFGGTIEPALAHSLGWIPGLGASPADYSGGVGLLLAIVVLVLMVVPLTTALIRDSLRSVPKEMEESGFALGATRWEVFRRVAIPQSRRGIWSALLIGFARAAGETVAVFMVIGDEVKLPTSLYSGSSTVASLLVGQFDSAFEYPHLLRALVEIALLLFVITLVANLLGRGLFGARALGGLSQAVEEGL